MDHFGGEVDAGEVGGVGAEEVAAEAGAAAEVENAPRGIGILPMSTGAGRSDALEIIVAIGKAYFFENLFGRTAFVLHAVAGCPAL